MQFSRAIDKTITFNADSQGLPSGVTLPGGTSKQFGYDPLMSLVTNVAVDSAQNAVMSRIYSRNKVQNIIGQETEHGTYAYQYDQLDQLTNSIHPVFTNESFVYDPMGNRLSSSGGMRVVASTYGANVLNQYTNLTTQQPGNSTTVAPTYDLNGNTLVRRSLGGGGTNYLAWDISDRLTSIHDASSNLVARYTYDPFGRRLSKTVFSGGTSNVTYFLYADEGLVAEFDEAGNEIRAYGYAPGSLWMNDPLYVRTASNTFYLLTDHLGAPQKLVDKNGAVVWAMVSESFGETVVWEGSTITNNLRFSSQYRDEESGLHYNTMRYYDAETGRYVGRDPIDEDGGLNLYSWCRNRPAFYIDAQGEGPIDWVLTREWNPEDAVFRAAWDEYKNASWDTVNGALDTFTGRTIDLSGWRGFDSPTGAPTYDKRRRRFAACYARCWAVKSSDALIMARLSAASGYLRYAGLLPLSPNELANTLTLKRNVLSAPGLRQILGSGQGALGRAVEYLARNRGSRRGLLKQVVPYLTNRERDRLFPTFNQNVHRFRRALDAVGKGLAGMALVQDFQECAKTCSDCPSAYDSIPWIDATADWVVEGFAAD